MAAKMSSTKPPARRTMGGLLKQLASEHVSIRQERCVLVRNRNASCLRCAQSCTSGCITYDETTRTVAIDQGRCVGCGTCATVCPTCALEARDPNDTELLSHCASELARRRDGRLVIACERARLNAADGDRDGDRDRNGDAVRVICLGRVDESLSVELAARGASSVVLACGSCDTCEHRPGRDVARQVRDTANELLTIWGSAAHVTIEESEGAEASEAGKAGRRADAEGEKAAGNEGEPSSLALFSPALFSPAGDGPAAPVAAKPIKVMADGTLPHFIPDRRERLLNALAELGEPGKPSAPGEPAATHADDSGKEALARTRLWGHVVIDLGACTSCRMCATFCPTGAIAKFDEPDGMIGVDHYASDCVKCLCCQNICRAKAITVEDDVPVGRLVAGEPERYAMHGVRVPKGGVHSIMNSMRDLLNLPEVFER